MTPRERQTYDLISSGMFAADEEADTDDPPAPSPEIEEDDDE
jgi:hypothetical protein